MSRHARSERPRGMRALGVAAAIVLTAGAGVAGAAADGARPSGASVAPPSTPTSTSTPISASTTPSPTPPPDAVLTLVAAGDVLPHLGVVADARTASGYDFTREMAPVEPWIAGADLAICHMEVPVAPAGVKPHGYPLFAAPAALVPDLAKAGWDGCSTASNHSVDQGEAGLAATLSAFDAAGLGHAGTARTAAEAATTQMYRFQREGQSVTVAHIAATFGTNGMPVPADYSVDRLDAARIVAQARAARAAGADVVVVSMHCCVEYSSDPAPEQIQIAQALADSGEVDLVIGHHAHVPQPIAHLTGGPDGTGMWVAYGLGNFISNQGAHCCTPRTDSGLVIEATIRQPAGGPARVEALGWTSVTVDLADGHQVEPLSSLAAAGKGVGSLSPAEIQARHDRVTAVVGTAAPELLTPPEPSGPGPVTERVATPPTTPSEQPSVAAG
ncbi:CapA family protein [Isoptericola sp. b441]|uniref:CapA family protein n=1 Tax=Actinotalea lenta TaxID=3064654 RepID=A0ABT9D9X9_9CELL|nr:CapA family protein [Isoptericola sp. b441]MDO8107380.1 CapA family protein [Isoptericola sp. b441]